MVAEKRSETMATDLIIIVVSWVRPHKLDVTFRSDHGGNFTNISNGAILCQQNILGGMGAQNNAGVASTRAPLVEQL